MKNFFNYPEPLYLELDNKFKEEVIFYFRWIMSKKKQKVLISFDHNGCTKVSEGGEGFYTKFLFSKLESLGDVSDLYLLVDSKISSSDLQAHLCSGGFKHLRYKNSLQKRLIAEVGGVLLFRSNDSEKLVIVD